MATTLQRLRAGGLGAFDALHVAWAMELGAAVFLTTDDRLAARAARLADAPSCRIMNPTAFIEDFQP